MLEFAFFVQIVPGFGLNIALASFKKKKLKFPYFSILGNTLSSKGFI